MEDKLINTEQYNDWIVSITNKIELAHTRASIKVNNEMLQLYFDIGSSILDVQKHQAWGSQVIDNLSANIKKNFPNSTGFSVRNLKYMRSFAEAYPQFPIVQVSLAQSKTEFVQEGISNMFKLIRDNKHQNIFVPQTEGQLPKFHN